LETPGGRSTEPPGARSRAARTHRTEKDGAPWLPDAPLRNSAPGKAGVILIPRSLTGLTALATGVSGEEKPGPASRVSKAGELLRHRLHLRLRDHDAQHGGAGVEPAQNIETVTRPRA
jgi:hypothetical protein